jgi:hypothetical protein
MSEHSWSKAFLSQIVSPPDSISLRLISFFSNADDVNIVWENIDTNRKNTNTLLDASEKAALEVNPEKTN